MIPTAHRHARPSRRGPVGRLGLGVLACVLAPALAACTGSGAASSASGTASSVTSTTAPPPRLAPGWVQGPDLSQGGAMDAVSCPTTTFCTAVDDTGYAYRFDGSTWSGPLKPLPEVTAADSGGVALSCTMPTFCVVTSMASNQVVTWNGTSWGAPSTIPGAQGLESVACAGASFCTTIDGLGDAFVYDGTGWTSSNNDWGGVNGISCTSPTFCVSVSGGISMWDGASWTQPQNFGATSRITGVSCTSPSFCVAVDSSGQALTWNGTTWSVGQVEPSPPTATTLGPAPTAVSCATAAWCTVVDDAGRVITWNGTAWSAPINLVAHGDLVDVACPAVRWCVAVDDSGHVYQGAS